eukprot:456574_1
MSMYTSDRCPKFRWNLYSFLLSAIILNTFISLQFIIWGHLSHNNHTQFSGVYTNTHHPNAIAHQGVKSIAVQHWGTKYRPIRVWCIIKCTKAIENREELWIIQETWGKHCDKLLFIIGDGNQSHIHKTHLKYEGGHTIKNVIQLTVPEFDIWGKCWVTYQYLYQNYRNDFDWIITADVDAWFSTYNFKGYAQYFDPEQPWYMGHTLTNQWRTRNYVFNAGGIFALSRGAIRKLVRVFKTTEFINGSYSEINCTSYSSWHDDTHLGICLKSIGIFPVNTLDEQHRLRWSIANYRMMERIDLRNKMGHAWYFKDRFEISPIKANSYATYPIAFHWFKDVAQRNKWYPRLDEMFSQTSRYNWSNMSAPQRPTTFLFNASFDGMDGYFNVAHPPPGQKQWKGVDNLWNYSSEE